MQTVVPLLGDRDRVVQLGDESDVIAQRIKVLGQTKVVADLEGLMF